MIVGISSVLLYKSSEMSSSLSSVDVHQLVNPNPPTGHGTAVNVGGAWVQVSRLGMPLVNEVVIGLGDKDKFNASQPKNDGQFASYVTNPTLPALLEIALAIPGACRVVGGMTAAFTASNCRASARVPLASGPIANLLPRSPPKSWISGPR